MRRAKKKGGPLCLAQVTLKNPVRPDKTLTYKCAKLYMHEGEHVSTLDPEQISYHWTEEDPVHAEREACAQIADGYRSTAAGKVIAALIRSRHP